MAVKRVWKGALGYCWDRSGPFFVITDRGGEELITVEQLAMFSQCTIRNIQIFKEAPKTESRTENGGIKLTHSQKLAIKAICQEHNIPEARFIYDALETYLEIFPYRGQLKKHSGFLSDMLSRLR